MAEALAPGEVGRNGGDASELPGDAYGDLETYDPGRGDGVGPT